MRVFVWLVMAATVWLQLSGCAATRSTAIDDAPSPLQLDDRVLIVSADTVTPATEFDQVGAGGVAGGFQVAGTEQVQCLVSGLDSALTSVRPNEQLALALQQRLKEYSNVDLPVRKEATEPGDVLYPKLLLVDADGKRAGSDDQAIVLKATLLRKKSDGTVRSFGRIDHFLSPRPLDQWCGLSRDELQRELLEGLTVLSQRMSDELLVAKELDLPSARTCPSYRGLAPVSPPVNTALPGRPLPAPVDTLRPELRWEPFPRLVDMAKSPIVPAVAGAIVYDLRVWQHDGDAPSGRTPVYAKTGLRETRHRVEANLKAGTTYAWEVRPRFYLDGVRRALPWSRLTYHVEECAPAAPDESPYLFETPVAGM